MAELVWTLFDIMASSKSKMAALSEVHLNLRIISASMQDSYEIPKHPHFLEPIALAARQE